MDRCRSGRACCRPSGGAETRGVRLPRAFHAVPGPRNRSSARGPGPLLVCGLLFLVLVCSASLPDRAAAADPPPTAGVPPRGVDPLTPRVTDDVLWREASHASRASEQLPSIVPTTAEPRAFVVGLKVPRRPRGVWRDQLLVTAEERQAFAKALLSEPGVQLVREDPVLPAIAVAISGRMNLARVRSLPFVDYVEPLNPSLRASSLPGCAGAALDPAAFATTAEGDVLPWTFERQGIPSAWKRLVRGPGKDVTVAVLDTGVIREQAQIQLPQFADGKSSHRSAVNIGSNLYDGGDTPWSTCDHGTRIAGLTAAPMDGRNVVGVAWKANLITVMSHASVVVGDPDAMAIARGIRIARAAGARIFVMAFGNQLPNGALMNLLSDMIRFEFHRTDQPGVLFVGAAGTFVCPFGNVAWPAYLDEVIAVAGVRMDEMTVSSDSCSGNAVDTAAIIEPGDIETTGHSAQGVIGIGGSSGATATIAGVLALIWSSHPDWTRDDVRQRLFASGLPARDPNIGFGVPDAYRAVGGFVDLKVKGPTSVAPGATYTLEAQPVGEGPFKYLWSSGETTQTVSRVASDHATNETAEVSVTDLVDETIRSAQIMITLSAGG
jgi:serine protease